VKPNEIGMNEKKKTSHLQKKPKPIGTFSACLRGEALQKKGRSTTGLGEEKRRRVGSIVKGGSVRIREEEKTARARIVRALLSKKKRDGSNQDRIVN